MAVPKFDELMLPLLKIAEDGQAHRLADVVPAIAAMLKLSEAEIAEQIPSGQSRLRNRTYWAKLYLSQAGALQTITPGVFQITDRGRALLNENHAGISAKLLTQYPEFVAFLKKSKAGSSATTDDSGTPTTSKPGEHETPQESLHEAYGELRAAVERDLLDAVQSAPPAFLESLVIKLLSAMGYGSDESAGIVLGGVHDGGVDGVVRKDRLGLGSIYVQAKRYKDSTVGAPAIQQFAGSMQERKADEGVFVTTSTFTKEARETVSKLHVRIALIDGARLAELMFELGIGVTTESVLAIKRLDTGFFPEA